VRKPVFQAIASSRHAPDLSCILRLTVVDSSTVAMTISECDCGLKSVSASAADFRSRSNARCRPAMVVSAQSPAELIPFWFAPVGGLKLQFRMETAPLSSQFSHRDAPWTHRRQQPSRKAHSSKLAALAKRPILRCVDQVPKSRKQMIVTFLQGAGWLSSSSKIVALRPQCTLRRASLGDSKVGEMPRSRNRSPAPIWGTKDQTAVLRHQPRTVAGGNAQRPRSKISVFASSRIMNYRQHGISPASA